MTIPNWLNLFPEVKWDRFTGDSSSCVVYGWIARDDGRADFMVAQFNGGALANLTTSSARLSPVFAQRLNCIHHPCQRVADHFADVEHHT